MSSTAHKIYIAILVSIVVLVFAGLFIDGNSYYFLSIENRSFHPKHQLLKPSGLTGHGLGIAGSALILIGVFSYMARKKIRRFSRLGLLRNWLEFHIFLCTLGPVLILYHTAFKFGGIVAISFWSMVAVFLSGVIGRYIYIQIPRTIEGREMSLSEISSLKTEMTKTLTDCYEVDKRIVGLMNENLKIQYGTSSKGIVAGLLAYNKDQRAILKEIKSALRKEHYDRKAYKEILGLFKKEIALNKRIDLLVSLQNMFRYWHVIHLPFALIMLVIMILHVIVAVLFGYRWIF